LATRIQQFARHAPSGQVLRYLAVGASNTLFSYGLFSLLNYLLTPSFPKSAYMIASPLSHVASVTVAFFGYKRFVFRSGGSMLKQYLRCHVVYGASFLIIYALLHPCVIVANLVMPERYSPYVAVAILMAANVVLSFFGHQRYTFGRKSPEESELSCCKE
jgi:putative flippase GtrA